MGNIGVNNSNVSPDRELSIEVYKGKLYFQSYEEICDNDYMYNPDVLYMHTS